MAVTTEAGLSILVAGLQRRLRSWDRAGVLLAGVHRRVPVPLEVPRCAECGGEFPCRTLRLLGHG